MKWCLILPPETVEHFLLPSDIAMREQAGSRHADSVNGNKELTQKFEK